MTKLASSFGPLFFFASIEIKGIALSIRYFSIAQDLATPKFNRITGGFA
jgi:hypothetical protein